MRQRSPTQIWTITVTAFIHLWALLEVFHLIPSFVRLLHAVTEGDLPLSYGFTLIKDIPLDVGLLVIGAVLVGDAWIFAAGERFSEARPTGLSKMESGASDIPEIKLGKAGIVLILCSVLVTVTFSVAGTARLLFVGSAFGLVVAVSVLLLWLRVKANSRVLEKLASTGRSLRRADEHLGEIEAYVKRNPSTI